MKCLVFAAILLGMSLVQPCGAAEPDIDDTIKKLGGFPKRDESAPGKPITRILFTRLTVTDADLKALRPHLDHVQELLFFRADLTDAAVKEIAALPKLERSGSR